MIEVAVIRRNVSIIRNSGGFDLLTLEFVIEGKEYLGIRVVQVPITTSLEDKALLPAVMAEVKAEVERLLMAEADAELAKQKVPERWTLSVESGDVG